MNTWVDICIRNTRYVFILCLSVNRENEINISSILKRNICCKKQCGSSSCHKKEQKIFAFKEKESDVSPLKSDRNSLYIYEQRNKNANLFEYCPSLNEKKGNWKHSCE